MMMPPVLSQLLRVKVYFLQNCPGSSAITLQSLLPLYRYLRPIALYLVTKTNYLQIEFFHEKMARTHATRFDSLIRIAVAF